MHNFFSFSAEDNRRLAEAFTDIADVIEIAIAKAGTAVFEHGVAAPERAPGPKPTAPLSVWKSYYRDHFDTVAAQNPDLGRGEIKELVAARWKALGNEERAPYQDRYKALKRQYRAEMAAYDARAKACVQAGHGDSESTVGHPEHLESLMSPHTLLQPTEHPTEPQSLASSVSPSIQPTPTVRFAEPDLSMQTLLLRPLSQPAECPDESKMLRSTDEIVEREMGPKPKRLKDSYDLYVLENIQRRQRENPGLSVADAKSGLASRWNRLSKEMRQPYFDRFEEMVKKYDVDIAAYYERARALLISAYGESSSPSDVLERMLACQIKQPVPAHYLYFLDVYEDIKGNNPGLGYYDARKVAAAQWKTASKEARQAYKDRFNASMEQYKIDTAAYEARERNILKTAIRKLRQPCESSTANTAQPAQYPPTDVLTSPVLPPLSQRPVSPMPFGPLSRTSAPSLPTSSVPPESSGLLPSLPAPIESIGSLWPAGSSASSLAALPSGAASSDVAAPAHPLAISWPAAIPFSDDCPASPPHSVNSGGLSGSSALAEETQPYIPATTPDLVAVAAANAAAALVTSQEQSLDSIPPAPDATTPAPVLPIESAEPSTPSKKKSKKKKRKHAADYDSLEPDEGHRKKKNKKKRMSNVVVKIESGVGEATTNTENGQADYAGIVVKTET